jgi:hypothetical protein
LAKEAEISVMSVVLHAKDRHMVPSFGVRPLYYRDPYRLHVAMLSEHLREKEMQYAAMLKAHKGLIRKHSTTREDIHS